MKVLKYRKLILYSFAALASAAAVAFLLWEALVVNPNPGYVIIGRGHWQLYTSFFLLLAALVVAFVVLDVLFRLLARALRWPRQVRQKGEEKRLRQSREALMSGLIDAAEGNWERAEQTLIQHAADSGAPLLNYLTAARSAQLRGAPERRDEYLQLALERAPQAELAVGLTQAELQLSEHEFDKALESLGRLQEIAPSHAAVRRLLQRARALVDVGEPVRHAAVPSSRSAVVGSENHVATNGDAERLSEGASR